MGLVRAHLAMLPRLDAEEAVGAKLRVAMGMGSLTTADQREINAHWAAAARPPQARMAVTPTAHDLKAIGIKVIRERRAPRGD